jgi:hypothetical protein
MSCTHSFLDYPYQNNLFAGIPKLHHTSYSLRIMPIVFSLLFQNIRVKLCFFFAKNPFHRSVPVQKIWKRISSCPVNLETNLFPSRKCGNQSNYGKNSGREGVHDAIGYGNKIIFWDLISVSYFVSKIARVFCVKKWLALISVPKYNRHHRKERRE